MFIYKAFKSHKFIHKTGWGGSLLQLKSFSLNKKGKDIVPAFEEPSIEKDKSYILGKTEKYPHIL